MNQTLRLFLTAIVMLVVAFAACFGVMFLMGHYFYNHPTLEYHGPEGNCYYYGPWSPDNSPHTKCFDNNGKLVCEYNYNDKSWCGH